VVFLGSVLGIWGALSLVRTIEYSSLNRVATSGGITSVKTFLKYGN
jgi:hypothetical protein